MNGQPPAGDWLTERRQCAPRSSRELLTQREMPRKRHNSLSPILWSDLEASTTAISYRWPPVVDRFSGACPRRLGRWPGTPGASRCSLNSVLSRCIGASTFPYPRTHDTSLVQLPPSMLNRASSALSSPMTAASAGLDPRRAGIVPAPGAGAPAAAPAGRRPQVADDRRGRAGRRRPGLAGACAARPRMCWRRAVSASCGNTGYSRPAVIASLMSGSCKHRFGRPPAYSASGSMGSLPQVHLCRMYS